MSNNLISSFNQLPKINRREKKFEVLNFSALHMYLDKRVRRVRFAICDEKNPKG